MLVRLIPLLLAFFALLFALLALFSFLPFYLLASNLLVTFSLLFLYSRRRSQL